MNDEETEDLTTDAREGSDRRGLPPLLTGVRRRHFAGLLGSGLGQAALAVLTAVAMPILLQPGSTAVRATAGVLLLEGALLLVWLRKVERVGAEKLGQDYVHEIRGGLVRAALRGTGPSLGVTVTRASNDLNSVRNWIALGIAPLAVAVPILIGTTVALALLEPLLVVAVLVLLAFLGLALWLLAKPTFARSRELRRRRGRLAGHLADTVTAHESIRAAGGVDRELRRVAERSDQMRAAAIQRAEMAGWVRGAGVGAGSAALVAVAVVGVLAGTSAATIATAITVVGILSAPLSDLGRVVEYRQSFRAAERILVPALAAAGPVPARDTTDQAPAEGADDSEHGDGTGLSVRGLVLDGRRVPDLYAVAGERVVLDGPPERRRRVLRVLSGLDEAEEGTVHLGGRDLSGCAPTQRRALVGLADPSLPLERSTVSRAVRYRVPDCEQDVDPILGQLGLRERVLALPKAERTRLRHGGEPLSPVDRALVHVARATYGDPALVLLDHVDRVLDPGAQQRVEQRLADCGRAVVVVGADQANRDGGADTATRWQV